MKTLWFLSLILECFESFAICFFLSLIHDKMPQQNAIRDNLQTLTFPPETGRSKPWFLIVFADVKSSRKNKFTSKIQIQLFSHSPQSFCLRVMEKDILKFTSRWNSFELEREMESRDCHFRALPSAAVVSNLIFIHFICRVVSNKFIWNVCERAFCTRFEWMKNHARTIHLSLLRQFEFRSVEFVKKNVWFFFCECERRTFVSWRSMKKTHQNG